jgi:hypothetical protein
MTALNFPASPSSGDVHNAANGLQYAFDGVKWTSQGTYDSGTINAQKLDSIASQFNGSTTTFNLKVNNNTVKPHNEQSVSIVLAGSLQEPGTAYTTSQTNGTITFASAPAGGTAFFGVLLTRLPVTSSSSGSVSPASGSAAGTMSASDFTKLAGIDVGAKDDQTGAEIKSAYEGEADTNAFTDADHSKLDGIAIGAEVNVQSNWNQTDNTADDFIQNKPTLVSALNDLSDVSASSPSNNQIIKWNGSAWALAADNSGSGGGGLSNVVEDTTPQLGGNLDVQASEITTSTTNGNIKLTPNGTGVIEVKGAGSADGTLQLNCSQNSHGVKIKSPAHSAGASYTLTLPTTDGNNGEFLKTDGSGVLSWGSAGSTSVTASAVNAAFADTNQLILGNGPADNSSEGNSDNDDALVLYYGTGSGTNYGVISADNGVIIQFDGSPRLETTTNGVDISGDLNVTKTTGANLVKIVGGEGARAELQLWADDGDDTSDKWHLRSDQQDYFQIAGLGTDGLWNAAFYAVPNGRSELLYDGVKKLETGQSYVRVTGDLSLNNDDHRILLGASQELQISHNTDTVSYISATGDLNIDATTGVNLEYNDGTKLATTDTGVSVTGNIVVSGNVDGRNVASDGSKLDGIASNANNYSLPTASASTLGGIKVGNNLSISNGVLSASAAAPTATTINALYPDNGNLILGTGTGDDTLKLYYDGTNAKITSNNAIHLQQDGANRLEISTTGTKWIGDLFCDDGQYIKVGTSADLRIYHASNNSYIDDQGAGGLLVKTSLFDVRDQNFGNSIFYGDPTGSGYLYYAGSYKFKTMTYGAFLNGNLQMNDNSSLKLGTGSDLRITHDGSNSYIESDTGNLIIKDNNSACIVKIVGYENTRAELQLHADDGDDPSDKWHLRADQQDYFQIAHLETDGNSWDAAFYAVPNGRSELLYDGVKKLETGTTYVRVTGDLSLNNDNHKILLGASSDLEIYHGGTNSHINNKTGSLRFEYQGTLKAQLTDTRLQLRDGVGLSLGNSNDLTIQHSGTHTFFDETGTGDWYFRSQSTTSGLYNRLWFESEGQVRLYYDGSTKFETESIGVSINGVLRPAASNSHDLGASDRRWATIYAVNALNTSDENEKKDITNCDLGLNFVNKINPVSYKWKDEQLGSKTHYGLLAQNIEDAVKSEGKTLDDFGAIHKPQHTAMALNYNQIIAPLVKAIQELSAKVAALEAA